MSVQYGYGEHGFQPIGVFDEEEPPVVSLLSSASRPSGREAAAHIRRLIRSIRRHLSETRILLRADSHYCAPEVLTLCETLGVDYVFGLATNARVRKKNLKLGRKPRRNAINNTMLVRRKNCASLIVSSTEPVHGGRNAAWLRASRSGPKGVRHAFRCDQSDQPSQQVPL